MKFEDIERDKTFIIAKKNKEGELVDHSKFRIDSKDNILRIWLSSEEFWINAPSNYTEIIWIRAIEKWGVIYDK